MLIITTESGTVYQLSNITEENGIFTGNLVRNGERPLFDLRTSDRAEEEDVNGQEVVFVDLPKVGKHFTYEHPVMAGCISTKVVTIQNDDG